MTRNTKLVLIKITHSIVWLFFNGVLIYLFYAVITNHIDKWTWICLGLFALEAVVLLLFRMVCPLTIIARQYSDSERHNFDIYLPEWLAKYNKVIYSSLLGIVIVMLLFRLIN